MTAHRGRPIEYDLRSHELVYSNTRRPIRPLKALLVRIVNAWCWL